ncbi:SIR2 family protein [uncultured Faecalibaculum sp.]|nr:SIR2 family protein [uncultured Faecalibaculum sp.]
MESRIEVFIKNKFQEFTTRPVVFFGAGMSKRYLSSPRWEELLKVFARKNRPENPYSWKYYKNRASEHIRKMEWSPDSLYPYIATLIRREYNDQFFADSLFESELKESVENPDTVTDPFKLAVTKYLTDTVEETPALRDEAVSLLTLDNRVSNFITTNYDSFLETFFSGYKVLIGQEDALNDSILQMGNIYKIHGGISNPDSIVLTKEDYDQFDRKAKFLSSKLLTMFVENPVIFIGYSLSDSNIIKILNDIETCISSENKKRFREKMIFIEYAEDGIEDMIEKTIAGIDMTVIRLVDYKGLYDCFGSITDRIDVGTLRRIQGMIHELVETAKPSVMNVHLMGLEDPKLENSDLAISITNQNRIASQGYLALDLSDICEDVLFDNGAYDPENLINLGILKNKSKFNNSKLPLYGYWKKLGNPRLDSWLDNKIIQELDDLYSASDKKRLKKKPLNYTDVAQITNETTNFQDIINKLFFSLKSLPIGEVETYIKSNWGRLRELPQKTNITKIVCYIDFMRNK